MAMVALRVNDDLILLQYGFPLAIIGGDYDSRMAYYDALEKVQSERNKEDFVLLIAEKVLFALERYINILSPKESNNYSMIRFSSIQASCSDGGALVGKVCTH